MQKRGITQGELVSLVITAAAIVVLIAIVLLIKGYFPDLGSVFG